MWETHIPFWFSDENFVCIYHVNVLLLLDLITPMLGNSEIHEILIMNAPRRPVIPKFILSF